MYKIECSGPFREGRAMVLLSSLVTQNIESPDVSLVSLEGVSIPTHRSMLSLHSKFLSAVIASIPCCVSPSISVPFNTNVVKNLLAIISCGLSLSLNKEDLLNVKYAADMLDIQLGQLEVQKDEKYAKGAVARTKASHKQQSVSPKPYDQNDDIADNDADEDELVEITPEIYNLEDDEDEEAYAPHFLMEAQYGDESSESVSNTNGWMNDTFGDDPSKQPELLEVEGGEGEEKKYKCSFCPNKEFKKKPEVMRHFKKHIPLSQRKRFQCEMCKEKFISNSNLKTHTKVCTGVAKSYICKRCKSEFDNKTDYEDHLAEVHNTGRNHECHICHKQLRRAGDVKKHMLTHSEGKPFVCDICGKRFRTESYVKVHKQAHFTNGLTPKKNARKEDRIEEETEDSILGYTDSAGTSPLRVGYTDSAGTSPLRDDSTTNGEDDLNGHAEVIETANCNGNDHPNSDDDIIIDDMIAEHVKYGMEEENDVAEPTVERLI
eukprot:GFUD01021909.1.p1 GENE.GFUD01021909.1~~GFUD01021909.1.p1  ORF type:complete len:490 (-),score=137.92 GFUD01021909.1:52-1521(-)